MDCSEKTSTEKTPKQDSSYLSDLVLPLRLDDVETMLSNHRELRYEALQSILESEQCQV